MRAVHATRLLFAAALLAAPATAAGQLISPKTIPVATGDQFLIHPSARLGMGGVGIALADSLGDVFVNPAGGLLLAGAHIYTAPTLYTVSDANGDGITLPVGVLAGGNRWFGGAALAAQQLEGADRGWRGPVIGVFDAPLDWVPQPDQLSERASSNLYAWGALGRRVGDGRTAVGVSAAYAALDAVDGVELLYARSERIEQSGHTADLRLGAVRELEGGGAVEVLLLHNRFDMTHDVTYQDWRWDPVLRHGTVFLRTEENLDRTHSWGAHAEVRRPVGTAGWRAGGIATLNYKTHPKIPNYEIMNIPRDPGHSWAWNLGAGAAREQGPATVAVDVVWEPIWSETWADAAAPVRTASGGTIAAGAKTVENWFHFNNALLRMGVGREQQRWGFQLGVQARAIRYHLEQHDHVRAIRREQRERWTEWTPTWGVTGRFPEFQLRYAGRLTTGTGRPGVAWAGPRTADAAPGATFLPAPAGPLTLQEARVLTHQVTVSVPVR